MDKEDYIAYWKKSADRDWIAVEALVASRNFVQALFFAHLVIEKLLKSHWVKDNSSDFPPRSHNLEHLVSQTNISITPEDLDEFRIMNAWNIEGRYQDYKDLLYKTTNQTYTQEKLETVNRIRQWLVAQLP